MNRPLVPVLLVLLASSACATTQAPDTLKKVKESGTLAIGFRDSSVPFSFLGSDDKPNGYSIDLCKRIAAALQQDLGLANLQIKWVKVTPEDRIRSVADGTVDIECGSTTHTLARQGQVDFTLMTFADGAGILVTAASGIRRVADLNGKKIAVIPGTTTEGALAEAFRRGGINAQIVTVKEHVEGLAVLSSGGADAYASDRVILIGLALASGNPTAFRLGDEFLSYEPYGFMVRRGDAAFRLAADRVLARIYRSGEIAKIYSNWFGGLGAPSDLLQAMYLLNGLPE
jgi:ABC-type amino acid transport substrate-binding protein